ncbi:hypothetical protein [Spectribacter hydrogenoxidans]|uniref:Uncharacterized protein n=1 Tax=Spectribacter hydrogenoxidans TaxID=3075608 RepID=A0ABU3C135_9GAMM|nr:hypothetical protein [Salinisphaera sp. W335]MDT0635074.1 hypothetical protein [Salinisphaera sp. W335]
MARQATPPGGFKANARHHGLLKLNGPYGRQSAQRPLMHRALRYAAQPLAKRHIGQGPASGRLALKHINRLLQGGNRVGRFHGPTIIALLVSCNR